MFFKCKRKRVRRDTNSVVASLLQQHQSSVWVNKNLCTKDVYMTTFFSRMFVHQRERERNTVDICKQSEVCNSHVNEDCCNPYRAFNFYNRWCPLPKWWCRGKAHKCHKIILASNSPVFKAMITGWMIEANSKEINHFFSWGWTFSPVQNFFNVQESVF